MTPHIFLLLVWDSIYNLIHTHGPVQMQVIHGYISLFISDYNLECQEGQKAILLDSFMMTSLMIGHPHSWYK